MKKLLDFVVLFIVASSIQYSILQATDGDEQGASRSARKGGNKRTRSDMRVDDERVTPTRRTETSLQANGGATQLMTFNDNVGEVFRRTLANASTPGGRISKKEDGEWQCEKASVTFEARLGDEVLQNKLTFAVRGDEFRKDLGWSDYGEKGYCKKLIGVFTRIGGVENDTMAREESEETYSYVAIPEETQIIPEGAMLYDEAGLPNRQKIKTIERFKRPDDSIYLFEKAADFLLVLAHDHFEHEQNTSFQVIKVLCECNGKKYTLGSERVGGRSYEHNRIFRGIDGEDIKIFSIEINPANAVDRRHIPTEHKKVREEKHKFEGKWSWRDLQLGAYRIYSVYEIRGTELVAAGREETGDKLFKYRFNNEYTFRRNGEMKLADAVPVESSFFVSKLYYRQDGSPFEKEEETVDLPITVTHHSFTHGIAGTQSYQNLTMSVRYNGRVFEVGQYPLSEKTYKHKFGDRIRWDDHKDHRHESHEIARCFIDTTAARDRINIPEEHKVVALEGIKSVQKHEEVGWFRWGKYRILHSGDTYGGTFQ